MILNLLNVLLFKRQTKKKWSFANNLDLRKDADMIIVIRAKELKNITASAYSNVPSEMYNGYKAIDKYFEEITKFYR